MILNISEHLKYFKVFINILQKMCLLQEKINPTGRETVKGHLAQNSITNTFNDG